MLNKSGHGTIYIGIDDQGNPISQAFNTFGKASILKVTNEINQHIKPQIYPIIEFVEVDGVKVMRIKAEGQEVPYSAYERYYIWVGESDNKMSPAELIKYTLKRHDNIDISNISSQKQELKFNIFNRYLIDNNLEFKADVIKENNHLLTKTGQYNIIVTKDILISL
jgi:predicted HTH transcriptional regulator